LKGSLPTKFTQEETMNEHVERIMKASERMGYAGPITIAEKIATQAYPSEDVDIETVTAALVPWIANHTGDFMDIERRSDWPLIVRAAELMAMAMLAQHRVDRAAANRAAANRAAA
jgi:hypothetical protein